MRFANLLLFSPRTWGIRAKVLLALGVIAGTSVIAVGLLIWTMSAQRETAETISRIEKLKMLSQRMAKEGIRAAAGTSGTSERVTNSQEAFDQLARKLWAGPNSVAVRGAQMRAQLARLQALRQQQYRRIDILRSQRESLATPREDSLVAGINKAGRAMSQASDQLVMVLEQRSDTRLDWVLGVSGGLLVLQGFGIRLIIVGMGRFLRRLKALAVRADRGVTGEEVHLGGATREDEVGQLAGSFEAMVRTIRERTRKLEQAKKHYEKIFEEVPSAIVITRPDGSVVEANQAAFDLGSVTSDEISEIDAREFYEDPDRREAFMDTLATEGRIEDFEARLRRVDGSSFVALVSSAARPGDHGPLYQTIIQDITLQTRQADQMVVLNRVLRHDMGNAATSVLGYVDLLEDEDDEERRQRFRAAIRRAGVRITRLTGSAGELMEAVVEGALETTPVDIGAIVRDEIAAACDIYKRLEITEWSAPEEPLYVEGTKILTTVVGNLLHNAVEHGRKERVRVQVSLESGDGSVVLRVADDGPGVPDHQKDAIFGKGEKGLASSGTGMGLYLADRVIEQCGGRIRVEDNDPTGAVFIVDFPVLAREEAPRNHERTTTITTNIS